MENFTDEKLIELAQNDMHNNYVEQLILRYKSVIKLTARNIYLFDGDMDDLIQEGNIALLQAIQKYSPDNNASFKTFAITCIKRRLFDLIRKNKQKIFEDIDNFEITNSSTDPYYEVLAKEIMRTIDDVSTDIEKKIINMFLDGFSYKEIAKTLNVPEKKVDNSLQKIRKTLKNNN